MTRFTQVHIPASHPSVSATDPRVSSEYVNLCEIEWILQMTMPPVGPNKPHASVSLDPPPPSDPQTQTHANRHGNKLGEKRFCVYSLCARLFSISSHILSLSLFICCAFFVYTIMTCGCRHKARLTFCLIAY